ncbi:MAG: SxtJ family membrane protein [Verrucomicrobiota bacterium]|nr:SxtJ family membrane protein [Verrucomicrobiota bacterium]
MLLLGLLLLWRHHPATGWTLTSLGSLLLLLAGSLPTALKFFHGSWMILSLVLGWVMSRLLLTIVFFLVTTPVGLLQRLFGKRSIEITLEPGAVSYWQSRSGSCAPSEYEKQF